MRLLPLCLCVASIPACATGVNPDAGTYACAAPWEIVLYDQNDIRSNCFDASGYGCDLVGIAVPSGVPTTLTIAAVDKDKQPCDPSLLSAAFKGSDFSVAGDASGNLVVTVSKDVFDNNGIEPSDTLTVTYGDLAAQWQVMSVVNLAGSWEITVDDLTVGDFGAAQSGRFIRWDTCAPNDPNPECSSGYIYNKNAYLASPIGSLSLQGTIAPTRAKLDGSWIDTSTGNRGLWTAVKVP